MTNFRWVVSLLAAAAVYAVMWLGYLQGWGWLTALDSSCLGWLHEVGIDHPLWVRLWVVVCDVLSPGVFRLLAAVVAVVLLARRLWRAAVFVLISVEFSELVSQTAKELGNRPRPVTAFVHASSSAFPSGHALGSIVGVLALLTVSSALLGRSVGVSAAVGGALIVLAVGFGRVALNVHHPSDVLAGWALGYLWFGLCWAISAVGTPRLRRRRVLARGREVAASQSACPRSV